MSNLQTVWDEKRVARLKALWAAGFSCSAIASRLGHVSRNAVIGKVSRLGLPSRKTSYRKPTKKPGGGDHIPKPKRPIFPIEPVVLHPEPVVPESERRQVLGRTRDGKLSAEDGVSDDQCRWIIGEIGRGGWHYCHHRAVRGAPQQFCSHHLLRATQPDKRALIAAKYLAPSAPTDEAKADREMEDA